MATKHWPVSQLQGTIINCIQPLPTFFPWSCLLDFGIVLATSCQGRALMGSRLEAATGRWWADFMMGRRTCTMASEPRQTAKGSKEMRLEGGSNKKCIIDVLDPRILELLELYQHVGVAILRHPDFGGNGPRQTGISRLKISRRSWTLGKRGERACCQSNFHLGSLNWGNWKWKT